MKKVFIYSVLFFFLFSVDSGAQRIRGINILGFSKKLFEDGFYKIALNEFRLYLEENPESDLAYVAQYYIGESYYRMNEFKNAAEQFLILTTRYPDAPNAALGWEGRGRCYENMGNFGEAAVTFETAGNFFFYKGDVASPFFLYAGENHLKSGNTEKAKENFLRITDNYPGSVPADKATYQLGLIYLKEGDAASALKEFEKCKYVDDNPVIAAGSSLLSGKIYMQIGDLKKSESEFDRVLNKYKNQTEFFNDAKLNLGKVYILDGSIKKGRDILEDFIKDAELPDSLIISGMITIGESYHNEGDYPQAEAGFTEIIEKYPLNSMSDEIFYKIALCYEKEENNEQALYYFRRSLDFSENYDHIGNFQKKSLNKIVEIYKKRGEFKEAADYMKKISDRLEGKDEILLIYTADLYEKGNHFLGAAQIYGILEKEFPKSQNIDNYIYKKGVSLGRGGQYSEAVKVFNKLLNDFPGCDNSEDIIRRISFIEESGLGDVTDKNQLKLLEFLNFSSSKIDAERAFEIGKYCYGINEFFTAKSLFEKVLEGEKNEAMVVEAAEYVTQCLDNIAKRYYIDGDILKYNIYLDSAFYAYMDYLGKEYFKGDFLDKAKLRIAEISIERESEEFEKNRKGIEYYTFLAGNGKFSMRDLSLFRLGRILTNTENNSGIDEIQAGRDYFNELINLFPNSKYTEDAKFELAKSFYNSGEIDKAINTFKKYLIEYPNGRHSPAVTAHLGRIELNRSNDAEASELFEDLSERFFYSNYVDSTAEEMGEFYFIKGDFDKAVEKFIYAFNRAGVEKLTGDGNPDEKVLVLSIKIASAYDSLGMFDEAILFLNDVIEKNQIIFSIDDSINIPVDSVQSLNNAIEKKQKIETIAKIYFTLGKIYENANYRNNAVETYKKIEAEFPDSEFYKDVLIHKSELLFNFERFADAREGYEKTADISENMTEKAYYKSRAIICLYRDNNIKRGIVEAKLFEREFKDINNRNFYKYQFRLEEGKAYYRVRNFSTAGKVFDDVEKKGEKTELAPEAALYIGLILQSRKNQVEAIKQFNSIISKYPQAKIWYKIYNTLGSYYYSIGKFGESARNFRLAVESSSSKSKEDDRLIRHNLIVSLNKSDWYDSEIVALREYVKLYPETDDIFNKKIAIGRALYNLGEYERAIEYLKPLLSQATLDGEVEIQMTIAEAYEKIGKNEKAVSEWLKILYYGRSNIPTLNTLVKFRLANICEKVGMYDKALQFFEEIVKSEGAASDLGKPAKDGIDRVKDRIESIKGYKKESTKYE